MTQKKLIFSIGLFLFCLLVLLNKLPKPRSEKLYTFSGLMMGTNFQIKYRASSALDLLEKQKIDEEIFQSMEDVNQKMSTYRDASELSLFNQSRNLDWFPISQETYEVIAMAMSVSRDSERAYDVTVGPLVNAWGSGPDKSIKQPPSQEKISQLMQSTGIHLLELQRNPPAIKKIHPSLYVDLSSIAKGYAVDQVAKLFDRLQISHYLIELGGEVKVKGKKGLNHNWVIGLERPNIDSQDQQQVLTTLSLQENSLATSGDYKNHYRHDGKYYSHTIDPKTGRSIEHNLASVSVIHPSCALADAWATALNVLGEEKGYQLAKEKQIAALFIYRQGDRFRIKTTEHFRPFLPQVSL